MKVDEIHNQRETGATERSNDTVMVVMEDVTEEGEHKLGNFK